MLETILTHLHNWFVVPDGIYTGDFSVKDGGMDLPFLKPGQYFRVLGSVFNDGLHQYPVTGLTDEDFTGAVWVLAIPKAVEDLAAEIEAWTLKNQPSAYTSESFGGYSYSRAAGSNGAPADWQDVFRSRLNAYRKPRELGPVQGLKRYPWYNRPFDPDHPWR